MTLEEKLEKFKGGTAVLHVPTQEIWDKIMVELENHEYEWVTGYSMTSNPSAYWSDHNKNTCLRADSDGVHLTCLSYYKEEGYNILELTIADFEPTAEELEKDIATLESLHKKYNTVITGNLENTMREKLKELQRVPMEITHGDYVINLTDVEVTKDDKGYHVISKGDISGHA